MEFIINHNIFFTCSLHYVSCVIMFISYWFQILCRVLLLRLFYFPGTVNPTKCCCPFALKMAACQLLLEITTFLRETFPYMPRPRTEPLVVSELYK